MENMNLASRCREAITHVAMLKKELLVQQKRAEELERQQQQLPAAAAAVPIGQQQQQQQMATPMQQRAPPQTPPMSADMKQALAASPPPPPPAGPPPPSASKRVSPNAALERQSSQRQEKRGSDGSSGSGRGNDIGGAAAPFVSGGANRVLAAKAQQQQQQMPASVDDDFSDEDEVDNFLDDTPDDELDVDDVTDKLSKEAFFGEEPGRPAQHLPTTPEKEDAVVGTNSPMGQVKSHPPKRKIQKGVDPDIGRPPSPVFSNAAMVKARTEMSTMSSIDAFEASFDTTFPTSFQSAVQKDGPAPSLDISFDVPDFSDPFYLGSDGDGGNISFPDSHGPSPSSSGAGMSMASGGAPSAAKANSFGGANSGAKQSRSSPASASGQVGKTPASPSPANSSFSPDLFPSSPMSELRKEPDFVGDEDMDRLSAPEFPAATPAVNGHGTSPQAPGPEKSGVGAAAARARYDAALGHEQPRSNGTNVPKSPGNAASIASKRELSNSASQVLKRIQQRRAKTGGGESPVNAADPPPESSPAQNGTAPASQFSPYGGGASATAGNAADAKLAAIRNSARRAPAGGTVDGDYGPKRRTAKPYSGGGDNLAMFKATNPSPSNSKYRSANSRTASHRLSPTSMNAELDNLDAIAAQAGTAPPSAATDAPATDGTRRSGRAVKQPVSYAEPSLNSKIRKGHQYFPKQNDAAAANGTGMVAPAASPAQPR